MTAKKLPTTEDGRLDLGRLVFDDDDAPDEPLGMSEEDLEGFVEAGRAAVAKAGRPSLTGAGYHSPLLSFRVPKATRELMQEAADRQHVTVSVLARRAIDEYLTKHA